MLRDVADAGVFVSAHPDVILKIGTKEVIYRTRKLGWGSDTYLYASIQQMREELPTRLASGQARVLKQYRGHSGIGVWKVQLAGEVGVPTMETLVRVRHAQRGCIEEEIPLGEFITGCQPYFAGKGRMIDQEYQERLTDGMLRCYLVHGKVAGFGHQAINALYPAPPGAAPSEAPQPGPRLYHPHTVPEFQPLKKRLETEWVPALQRLLEIDSRDLTDPVGLRFPIGAERRRGAGFLCALRDQRQ